MNTRTGAQRKRSIPNSRRGSRKIVFFFSLFVLLLVSILLPHDATAAPIVISGVVNNYYPGTTTASAGATSIALGAARNGAPTIGVGTLLLIIQMQNASINASDGLAYGANNGTGSGSTALSNTGAYEYVTATNAVGAGGGTLTISSGLINTYTNAPVSNAGTLHGQWTFQVVVVPVYGQVQLAAPAVTSSPWNGTTGGIVAFDARDFLDLNGQSVDVSGQGFRGGGGVKLTGTTAATGTNFLFAVSIASAAAQIGAHDTKGEGIAGTPVFLPGGGSYLTTGTGYPIATGGIQSDMGRGAPGNAGGGSTDPNPTPNPATGAGNDDNTGGGGGGNGGPGGQGGCGWSVGCGTVGNQGGLGGASFTNSVTRLIMGGGGGAGTENNQDNGGVPGFTPGPSHGASGGGIVLLRTCNIINTGTINANGATAPNSGRDGAGGGGAGGTVLVTNLVKGITGLTINANGGNGGSAWILQNGTVTATGPSNNRHGPGGGGGGGAILTSGSPGASVNGGVRGVTTMAGDPYGATSGGPGATTFNIPATSILGTPLSCIPTAVTLSSFSASSTANDYTGSSIAFGAGLGVFVVFAGALLLALKKMRVF